MIKQIISIEHYWQVIVWYNLDYDCFNIVEEDLINSGITADMLEEMYYMMLSGKAKAVTYSNLHAHSSIVLFNFHEDKADYMDSLVHEAEHIKQAMLKVYDVLDEGEPPAYTIGYIVRRMWEVFRTIVCRECGYQ